MHETQTRVVDELTNSDGPTFAKLMTMAERELGAFIRAVTELFGSEQARLAAEDWLDELVLMEALPGLTSRDWRSITIAASATRKSGKYFRHRLSQVFHTFETGCLSWERRIQSIE